MLRLIIFVLLSLSFFNIAAAKELKVNVINMDITSVTDHLPIMAEIIE